MQSNCSDAWCGQLETIEDESNDYVASQIKEMKENLQYEIRRDMKRDEKENQEQKKSMFNLFNVLGSNDIEENEKNRNSDEKPEASTDEEAESDIESGKNKSVSSRIMMISGCDDSQTSADVMNVSNFSLPDPNGKAGGACTSALLQVLYANHRAVTNLTFVEVLSQMRSILRRQNYTQIPQLTSSEPVDVDHPFYIVPEDCQGTKRAVLIGINYVGHDSGELSGCHNDCLNMKDYIMNVWGFEEDNIIVLMDDGVHPSPTRSNILAAYKTAAASSESGDAMFCHYSGHGGRLRDDDWGEEQDGYDETLVPVDYMQAGQIRDDDLYQALVKSVPEGVHVVALMDCCHSGTVLDLPYIYRADGDNNEYFDDSKIEQLISDSDICGGKSTYAFIACAIVGGIIILPLLLI